jgi:hypothetical protein
MKKHQADDDGARPVTKRGKCSGIERIGEDDNEEEDGDDAVAILRAWEHYRNFVDGDVDDDEDDDEDENDEDENCGGDIDELLEVIDILDNSSSSASPSSISATTTTLPASIDGDFRFELVPMLLSMSHVHLASRAVSEAIAMGSMGDDSSSSSSSSPEYHFRRSLHHWPTNPVAHLLLANYRRMSGKSSLASVCDMYEKAASYANRWRNMALDFMDRTTSWVELLILNGALDVEYVGGDVDRVDDGEEDDEENDEELENDDGAYSSSGVEATASFMSAFILSSISRHDEALGYLRKFCLTHRIHPNVWAMAMDRPAFARSNSSSDRMVCDSSSTSPLPPPLPSTSTTPTTSNTHNTTTATTVAPSPSSADFLPGIYCGWGSDNGEGALPPELYQRLCDLFAPGATYWKESDYNNRGYYSYYLPLVDAIDHHPTNVIEDAIVKHLLPLAENSLRDNKVGSFSSLIVGAEWWVHTRPLGSNLGHQVHFDTDESLLNRERRVTHPILSSVMYLTGAGRHRELARGDDAAASAPAIAAGSTVVFDQTPESTDVAPRAWVSHPRDNAFMVFPGNLLHGVLPCSGVGVKGSDAVIAASCGGVSVGDDDDGEEAGVHRLTLMIGFWTRNVIEGMAERELYTPCGPMPPPVAEHSWVIQAQQGYCEEMTEQREKGNNSTRVEQRGNNVALDVLPSTSPAWEEFSTVETSTLTVPKGLDHRFFVLNAPNCFSESLYEKGDLF